MNQNEGFSKSTAALAKTFMYRAFDSEEYARSLSAQSDGDKDLIEKLPFRCTYPYMSLGYFQGKRIKIGLSILVFQQHSKLLSMQKF